MREKIMIWCILVLLFSANIIHAQKGFLNIACGSMSNFTDTRGLTWIPDIKYIKVGQTQRVSQNLPAGLHYFQNLRKFPEPLNKSCYEIPVSSGQRYLLRLWFIKNNVINNYMHWPGAFKYSVETTDMLYESDKLYGSSYEYEQVLMTKARIVHVCLNRISEADPFLSAIQMTELKHGMYQWASPGRILVLPRSSRVDLGGDLNPIIRYPIDDFDRLWYPGSYTGKPTISTTSKISADSAPDYPPSAVMQTAVLFNTSGGEILNFKVCGVAAKTLILFYFSEIRNSTKSVSFSVSDSYEGTVFAKSMTLLRNYTATELAVQPKLQKEYHISLKPLDGKSAIPVSALEFYSIVNTVQRTASEDVEVLNALENRQQPNSFNVSWIADPCFVSPWQYVSCSSDMRVSHLYLSGKHLSGSIPKSLRNLTGLVYLDLSNNSLEGPLPDLSNLTMLETIDVSNNKLNGSLPGWLVKLTRHKLKEIYVENNNFSGEIPSALDKLDPANFTGNPYLHRHYSNPNSKEKSQKSHAVIIGATVGGVLVLFILTTILIVFLRCKKMAVKAMNKKPSSSVKIPQSTNCRSFTMEEMKSATQNFSRKIGRGGFGCVYYGQLPKGVEIAVKVLSLSSRQGTDEFLNEVVILSRLNHRSLVKLLGYCNDSDELMLVYEYMPRGSLKDHLSGNIETSLTSSTRVPLDLPWKNRLKIALDAARGLEYLHSECNPRIVHRDLKSANILLENKLNGRLSDLGLSRAVMDDDATHVTTTVKGTAGYLDPEYFNTHALTEKSDVYSFGVVLLELVSGRAPIDQKLGEDQKNLIKWVTPYVEKEDPEELETIVDWRLKDRLRSIRSIGIVSKLAMRCVTLQQSARPDARELVQVLEEAMTTEDEAVPEADSVHSSAPRGGDSATSSSYSHNVDSAGSSHNHSDKLRSDETTA